MTTAVTFKRKIAEDVVPGKRLGRNVRHDPGVAGGDGEVTTTAADLYRYAATITRWVDGDTAKADVDLGCRVYWRGSLRVAGMNAPEVHGASKQAGLLAATEVERLCPVGTLVYLNSLAFEHGDELDDFGRMLAEVTLSDGRDLAEAMIAGGYAVVDEP